MRGLVPAAQRARNRLFRIADPACALATRPGIDAHPIAIGRVAAQLARVKLACGRAGEHVARPVGIHAHAPTYSNHVAQIVLDQIAGELAGVDARHAHDRDIDRLVDERSAVAYEIAREIYRRKRGVGAWSERDVQHIVAGFLEGACDFRGPLGIGRASCNADVDDEFRSARCGDGLSGIL